MTTEQFSLIEESAINGQFKQAAEYMIEFCVEPIEFFRYYDSPNHYPFTPGIVSTVSKAYYHHEDVRGI